MNSDKIPRRVMLLNTGGSYTTHINATKYGCINYARGIIPKVGQVYNVINKVLVNGVTPGYVIEKDGLYFLHAIYTSSPQFRDLSLSNINRKLKYINYEV